MTDQPENKELSIPTDWDEATVSKYELDCEELSEDDFWKKYHGDEDGYVQLVPAPVTKKKKKKKKKKKIRVSSLLTHGSSTRSFLRTRGTHEGGREDGLDPNYEFRYIRKTAVDIGRRHDEGWDLVDNSDQSIVGPNNDNDSTVNTHDLVLAKMPKEMHDKVKLVAGVRSRERITGAMDFEGSEDDGKTGISFAEDQ